MQGVQLVPTPAGDELPNGQTWQPLLAE